MPVSSFCALTVVSVGTSNPGGSGNPKFSASEKIFADSANSFCAFKTLVCVLSNPSSTSFFPAKKSNPVILLIVSPIKVPIPPKIFLTPSTKDPNIPPTFVMFLIRLCIPFKIFGRFSIAHPIKRIPIKLSILPKNPLLLFAKIAPCVFGAP